MRSTLAPVLMALACATATAPAFAQVPNAWANNQCVNCHGPSVRIKTLHAIEPLVDPDTYFEQNAISFDASWFHRPEDDPPTPAVDSIRERMADIYRMNSVRASLSVSDLALIHRYFLQVRDGVVTDGNGITTSVIAFPAATVGGTATTARIILRNWRRTPLIYAEPVLRGANPNEFSVSSESCPDRSIAAGGGSCWIDVRFQPSAGSLRSASLPITLSSAILSPATPQVLSLSGIGQVLAAAFSINTRSLSFGATVGGSSLNSATVANTGDASLELTAVAIDGAGASDYAFGAANTCAAGARLAPGSSCTLALLFTPLSEGTRAATLRITHGATNVASPVDVALTGAATPTPRALVQVDSTALSFGDGLVGQSARLSLRVVNAGQAPLVFTAFEAGGPMRHDFAVGGDCAVAVPVPAGGSCKVEIGFAPSALGHRAASLRILSNASNDPAPTIALTGSGVPLPVPQLTLPFVSLDFGSQSLTGSYPAQAIGIRNTGTADLVLASVEAGGAYTVESPVACPALLAPGAECVVRVRFRPTALNTVDTGALAVSSNAPGSPHRVALQGKGVADVVPTLLWAPSAIPVDFGQVPAGTASDERFALLHNAGPGGVVLGQINAVGMDASSFTVAALEGCAIGQTLPEGESCRIGLRFVPGAAGARQAAVQVMSSGSLPSMLELSGTGLGESSPRLVLSAPALAFGAVAAGAQSLPLEMALANGGTAVLHVSNIETAGPYTVQYKSCAAAPFDLSPGASCSLSLSFIPTTQGAAEGSLSINSNVSGTPVEIPLSGSGDAVPEVSGGGCSLARGDTLLDPALWLMVFGAIGVLVHRLRVARSRVRNDERRGTS